jgi:hypothetical protein
MSWYVCRTLGSTGRLTTFPEVPELANTEPEEHDSIATQQHHGRADMWRLYGPVAGDVVDMAMTPLIFAMVVRSRHTGVYIAVIFTCKSYEIRSIR